MFLDAQKLHTRIDETAHWLVSCFGQKLTLENSLRTGNRCPYQRGITTNTTRSGTRAPALAAETKGRDSPLDPLLR